MRSPRQHPRNRTEQARTRWHAPARWRPTLTRLEDRTAPAVLTFQEGANTFAGTQDTALFSGTPTTNLGSATSISVDQDDGGVRQALLRFDTIIGTGTGQIPPGSVINSASVTFNVTSSTAANANLGLYRMLVTWTEATTTWNSLGPVPGLQTDGTDALAAPDGILGNPATGAQAITVTAGLQAWANGASNFGWGIRQDSGDGWDFTSSEGATAAQRPLLTVDYTPPSGAGTLQFSQPAFSVVEGNTTATITVARVGGTSGAASVQYAISNGTASSGQDFTAASGTLNFADGVVSQTFTVTIADDTALEGTETVNLTLSNATGAALGTPATTTLAIADQDVLLNEVANDLPGSDNPFEYVELIGNAVGNLTNLYFVQIEGDGTAAGTFDSVVNLGSAVLGSNGLLVLKSPTGGYTIPVGTTVVTNPLFDTDGGGLENGTVTFALVFSPTAPAAGTDLDANNDGVLELPAGASVVDAVGWNDGGGADLVYGGVRLSQAQGVPGAATRILGNGLPTAVPSWYNGFITSTANPTYATGNHASINIPAGAKLTPGTSNLPGVFVLSQATYTANETGGTVTITVNRVGDLSSAATVQYATANGTAVAGQDYTAATGTLNFVATDASETFTITITNDTVAEGPEAFTVALSNPGGTFGIGAPGTATITIDDDEATTANFQQGFGNYAGTQDTALPGAAPTTPQGDAQSISVDPDDGSLPIHGLLRFDNLVGAGTGQVPLGARVFSATLTIRVVDAGSAGARIGFFRMLTDWNQATATWAAPAAGITNGVTPDDVEARAVPDMVIPDPVFVGTVELPVPLDLAQSWVNGANNFGWALVSDSGSGWDFLTSESLDDVNRPKLTISYTTPAGPGSFQFEEPTYTVTEDGTTATVSVLRVGGANGAASVSFATANGTATAGQDYTTAGGPVSFADGEVRKTFTVTIANDTASEANETINLTLSGPTGGATLGTRTAATLTVKDNDLDPALLLNELLVNPPGTDLPFEYVELLGSAAGGLGNVYVIGMEGDTGVFRGNADLVFNLSDLQSGSNGLTTAKAANGGHTIPAGATVFGSPLLDATNTNDLRTLQNGTNSFLLVYSPVATMAQQIDFDWNNDGTLDLPTGAVIVDAVGWSDGGTGDVIYGGVTLTQSAGTPAAATRIRGNTTKLATASWYNGNLSGTTSDSLIYDPAGASANLPAGARLTPGAPNFEPGGAVAPRVTGTPAINGGAAQRSLVTSISIAFDQVVTFAGQVAQAFTLARIGGGAVTFTATSSNATGVTVVTLNAFTGTETTSGSLNDGRYTLSVVANQVTAGELQLDGNGDGTAGDNFTFADSGLPTGNQLFRFYGDVTGDRFVNGADFAFFRTAFGTQSPDPNYNAAFDINGDGFVNGADFAFFRTNFGLNI